MGIQRLSGRIIILILLIGASTLTYFIANRARYTPNDKLYVQYSNDDIRRMQLLYRLDELNGNNLEEIFGQGNLIDVSQQTLDSPIVELNGHTLREVFEDGNVFSEFNIPGVYNATVTKPTINSWIMNYTYTGEIDTYYTRYESTRTKEMLYINFDLVSKQGTSRIYNDDVSYTSTLSKYEINIGNHSSIFIPTTFQLNIPLFFLSNSSDFDNVLFENIIYIPMETLGISTLSTAQMDYYYSIYQELNDLDGGLNNEVSNNFYTNEHVIIYIESLKTKKQYSPLFEKTFNLMSDAEIKIQLDMFIQQPQNFINYNDLNWFPSQAQLDLYYQKYLEILEGNRVLSVALGSIDTNGRDYYHLDAKDYQDLGNNAWVSFQNITSENGQLMQVTGTMQSVVEFIKNTIGTLDSFFRDLGNTMKSIRDSLKWW